MADSLHTVRFPDESDAYRTARAELLEAEIDLRRRTEEVAAQHRRLPLGGPLYAPHPEGQDGRHVDSIWPLWNIFDLTPEGRGTDWYPRLAY